MYLCAKIELEINLRTGTIPHGRRSGGPGRCDARNLLNRSFTNSPLVLCHLLTRI
jgi:hypothetical protein